MLSRSRVSQRAIGLHATALAALAFPPFGASVGPWARASAPVGELRWERVEAAAVAGALAAVALEPGGDRVAFGGARGALAGSSATGYAPLLRRGPIVDLAFATSPDAAGEVLVATDAGLYRAAASREAVAIAPAPGAAASAIARVASAAGVAAVATAGGVFASRDTVTWQRLAPELPSRAATALALRPAGDEIECWVALQAEIWRVVLAPEAEGLRSLGARRVTVPFAEAGGPVDIAFDVAGASVVLVYPTVLAVPRSAGAPRGANGDAWRALRPALPPGARIARLAAGVGRIWLATDRGLLEARTLAGPWRRAAPPAGATAIPAVAADASRVFAATRNGLAVGREVGSPPDAVRGLRDPASPEALRPPPGAGEPGIEEVHRVAVARLELGAARLASLRRGVERRGWLPTVDLSASYDRGRDRGRDEDEAFVSGAHRHLVDRDWGDSSDYDVSLSLSWDLGDLLYHPESIDVSRETRELLELRDDVLDEITQLYFERLRVLAQLAAGAETSPDAERLRLRARELAAGIDAWTGGWFGRRVSEPSARAP